MSPTAALELGGTKTLVAVGTDPYDLEPVRVETRGPEETLERVLGLLSGQSFESVGMAAFGPIELSPDRPGYGRLMRVPKPGWSGFDLLGWLAARLDVPLFLDTDVNAAAVGEWRWGAAAGADQAAYLTIGTGIGAGLVVRGSPLHGAPHPEVGHIVVQTLEGDSFDGVCPYHSGCLEGMASGPALRERFGVSPEELSGPDLESALAVASGYLAQGLANVIYSWAPDRIVVGGGVSNLPGFHQAVRRELVTRLAGYPSDLHAVIDELIVSPALGDRSALAGAFALASSG